MKKWIIGLLAVVLCLALSGCGQKEILLSDTPGEGSVQEWLSDETASGQLPQKQVQNEAALGEKSDAALSDEPIYAYICGEVTHPGVYPLPAGSRIYELVDAAGGMTEDAAQESVNLAETLTDGQMVSIADRESFVPSPGGQAKTAAAAQDDRIDLNLASRDELLSLNGIGDVKADSILSYREANGGFSSTEELMQVDGIGQGTYDKIKDKIRV